MANNRIRELRKAKGWTQHDLAMRSGIDTSDISRIENGQPFGLVRAERLANALGIDRKALWR